MVGTPKLPSGPEENQKAQKSSHTIQEVELCETESSFFSEEIQTTKKNTDSKASAESLSN